MPHTTVISLVLLAVSCWTLVTQGSPISDQVGTSTTTIRDIKMPDATPTEEDQYMCTAVKMPEEDQYITGYEALADDGLPHHMLLFGCEDPFSDDPTWECGPTCSGGEPQIVFAWARHAPPMHMPQDVGYHIGGDSGIKYLVLQIHYRYPVKGDNVDTSGLRLTISQEKQKYLAGVSILLTPSGIIPPHQPLVHMDISCKYKGASVLHPIGFRTHAHDLARVISGYQFNTSFHLIGKGNPQWPQSFYPAEEGVVIKPGDSLAARCTFNSMDRDRSTRIGSTHSDEMCNFYMMYYTESSGQKGFSCYGDNIPSLTLNLPAGSDVPPPRNEELEEAGDGHTHHHEHDEGAAVESEWPQDHIQLGQIGGVATDSLGNVHVFHRGTRTWDSLSFDMRNKLNPDLDPITEKTLVTFDPEGKVIKQWGDNLFYMPHGLHIDAEDNIWVTDVGLHQVMKFSPGKTTPSLILGSKLEPGDGDDHFCKPTDVAVLDSGEFFVSDGYCNHRVLKFSKEGKLLKKWGFASTSVEEDGYPPAGSFDIPHSITALGDRSELCVADRENGRIQCFDYDGKFLRQIHPWQFQGRLFAVSYSPKNGLLYAVNGPSLYREKIAVQGFTLDPQEGTLLETWGAHDKAFSNPHDVAVSPQGDALYVGELDPTKVWRIKINRDMLPNHLEPQSEKKAHSSHHPSSVDNSLDGEKEEQIEEEEVEEAADIQASMVIAGLLIVPIVVIIGITVFLRLRKSGKLGFFSKYGSGLKNRRFNLGQFFNRHSGFDRLNTEESDELDHLNSDSEVEEYSATSSHKA